jgi:transmembrane sensor
LRNVSRRSQQQALAEFERYGPTRMVLRDPVAAALRVSGSFGALRPDSFLQPLVRLLPLRLQETDAGTEIVSSS